MEILYETYRKSSNTSRPLIQVASIRGRTIGGPVQPLIVGKFLNHSKLPYLDHFELFEVKNLALKLILIEIPLGNLGFKIIQSRLLIEDLRYVN